MQNKNRLILAPSRPQRSVKKYDSFLGLALIDDRSGFRYPYTFHSKSDKNIASIHAKGFIKGALEQEQCGLDTLGVFSTPLKTPSLLSDSCCSLVGMGTSRGVIDSYYIKHFLQYNSNELQYGDAGIRLERRKNGLHVSEVDPFFPDQKFQINDQIIAFDGKKVTNLCSLRRSILFAKIASLHSFTIKRQGRLLHVRLKIQKRLGGGLMSDTFLERFGLHFDSKLCIASLTSKAAKMQLHVNDCLIQVNFHDVQSAKEIQKNLQKGDIDNALLFERQNFQFFIHINAKTGEITKTLKSHFIPLL